MKLLWKSNKVGMIAALGALIGMGLMAFSDNPRWELSLFGAIWVAYTVVYMYLSASWRELYERSESQHQQRRKAFWS